MVSPRAGGTDWLAFITFNMQTFAGYATSSDFVGKGLPFFRCNHVDLDFILALAWSLC